MFFCPRPRLPLETMCHSFPATVGSDFADSPLTVVCEAVWDGPVIWVFTLQMNLDTKSPCQAELQRSPNKSKGCSKQTPGMIKTCREAESGAKKVKKRKWQMLDGEEAAALSATREDTQLNPSICCFFITFHIDWFNQVLTTTRLPLDSMHVWMWVKRDFTFKCKRLSSCWSTAMAIGHPEWPSWPQCTQHGDGWRY